MPKSNSGGAYMEEVYNFEESDDFDVADDRVDYMDAWELGFEAGVTQAEEEVFEDWDEDDWD